MSRLSFSSDDVASSSGSFSDDSGDITLPPELLERERQLIERNKQLEARVKDLFTSLDSEEVTPQTDVATITRKAKQKALPKPHELPPARPSPTKDGIIEVEVPIAVEPVEEVRVDPVPELRAVLHKISTEITAVNGQISDMEATKTQAEVEISRLQAEFKRLQVEGERAQQVTLEMTKQIEAAKEQITKLKNDVNSARLSRIERVQLENEAKKKQSQLEVKVRRQRAAADRLQSELNLMQSVDSRASKANAEKSKLKQGIEDQRKAIRQLKLLLSEVQRATAHEEKIFDHIQAGRDLALTTATVERAITELL